MCLKGGPILKLIAVSNYILLVQRPNISISFYRFAKYLDFWLAFNLLTQKNPQLQVVVVLPYINLPSRGHTIEVVIFF